jgi:hypothetical protein
MTTPTIPPVPGVPSPRSLTYHDTGSIATFSEQWLARDAALNAEIARLTALLEADEEEPAPKKPFVLSANWWCADGMRDGKRVLHHLEEHGPNSPEIAAFAKLAQQMTGTEYSFDTSALGNDASKSEASKIDSHKALFGTPRVRNVRVFFGSAPPTWTGTAIEHKRIAALKPGDSFAFSSLSTDWAAWDRFLKATPDHMIGNVEGMFGHEREADLSVSGGSLKAWLASNDRMFDVFDANGAKGYSSDNAGKTLLFYSQEVEKNADTPNREQMYGGQDRGWFGEDVYNPRASATYWSADRLLGPIIRFCEEIGRPCRIPEWGAERVESDTTGAGRAKLLTDGAAFIAAANARNA